MPLGVPPASLEQPAPPDAKARAVKARETNEEVVARISFTGRMLWEAPRGSIFISCPRGAADPDANVVAEGAAPALNAADYQGFGGPPRPGTPGATRRGVRIDCVGAGGVGGWG